MIYLPEHFDASNHGSMRDLIDRFPLATLVTQGPDGISANHIPLMLEPRTGTCGTLIGHVARNNIVWRDGHHLGEALAIFQAFDAYISPNWYPSKQETHEVVPTWNYAVVHAYGPIIVHEDEKWLRGVVGKLTRKMEGITSERPWKMADAPIGYMRVMLENIVGIEIPLTRMVGKTKASQNRTVADRQGAIAGLRATGDAGDLAMADQIDRISADDRPYQDRQ
jgi:transcriptional regulator